MKVTITINLDNAAFDDEPRYELARIVCVFALNIDRYGIEQASRIPMNDINGNRVGSMELTDVEIK